MKSSLRLCLLTSVGAVSLWTTAAWAQQTAQKAGLEEIVVTAQRREEKLQDVPVSVIAFSAADLDKSQVLETKSLQVMIPNLTMSGAINGASDMIISIRGVSPGTFNPNTDTAVGMYVDGVYYARGQGSNMALVDVERVEILRGPQGTLFGRNTIGGALNITTHQPTDQFAGSVKIGAGNYDQFGGTVVLNVPVVPGKLDVRGVYDHQQHGGYGYNTFLKTPQSDQHQDYMRLTTLANLSDNITFTLSGDHMRSHANSEFWVVRYFDPVIAARNARANVAPYLCTGDCRTTQTDFNPQDLGVEDSIAGTLTWDLGFGTLKSISSARRINFPGGDDVDGTPIRYVGAAYSVSQKQYTQELQLYGKALDDRLNWISGLYYFAEKVRNDSPVQTIVAGVPITTANFFYGKNTSKSAFAQLTYEVIPRVKLTGGIRYNEDTRIASYHQVILNPPVGKQGGTVAPLIVGGAVILPACRQPAPGTPGLTGPVDPVNCTYNPAGQKYHYVPWTVGLDYKATDDILLYAKVSKGYRGGGYQLASGNLVPFQYTPFGPENVTSYELGSKTDFLDNRLRLNAAAFYTHYKDIQVNLPATNPLTGTTLPIFINAGVEDIKGIELEATALLGDLRLNANLGLLDPQFKSAPFSLDPLTKSNPVFVSHTTWSVAADYPMHLEKGTLNFHLDYGWQSKNYNYAPANVNTIPFNGAGLAVPGAPGFPTGPLTQGQIDSFTTPAYGLLAGSISFTLDKPDVTVTVWGRNLANTYFFYRSLSTYASGYNAAHPYDPRTFGATVGYNF